MPIFEWTITNIVFFVIITLMLSILIYLLRIITSTRKNNTSSTQMGQVEKIYKLLQDENQIYKEEIKQLNASLSEKQLSQGKMQIHLDNAALLEQKLNANLQKHKDELALLEDKLEESKIKNYQLEKNLREQSHHVEKQLEVSLTNVSLKNNQVEQLEYRIKALENLNMQLQDKYQIINKENATLKTSLENKEENFKEQVLSLNEAKKSLTFEFENLANKIFEEKGKTFVQSNQISIDTMLKPFREQIEGFQKRINEVHDASLQGHTNLNAEIKKILDIGLQMSSEANNLTSALKGDSQQRGAWGEAQLCRTLEMSGLVEGAHFSVQQSFRDPQGKQKQTDYLIKLPDSKHIIIDSKVTLNAYDRVVSSKSVEEYQIAIKEHIQAVRKHIDDLASKDYTNLIGMHSPDFVLMFMPIEPAYIEALKYNKDLFEYGYTKGVVLVSHTTLIPILRTVSNLWKIEQGNAEAREIIEKAGDIYNSVYLIAERLNKLGNTLNTASTHYNSTITALVGKQGLYGKVDRFTQISSKINKNLPEIETTSVDFETDRLEIIMVDSTV